MIEIKLSEILDEYRVRGGVDFICEVIWGICQRDYGVELTVGHNFRQQWCEKVLGRDPTVKLFMEGWNAGTAYSKEQFEKATGQEYEFLMMVGTAYRGYRIWVLQKALDVIGDVKFQFSEVE